MDQNWILHGKGAVSESAAKDAAALIKNPGDLEALKQHMRDSSNSSGNPGESIYVDAVNAELKKSGANFSIQLGLQSTAVNMQPGEYGTFRIVGAGSTSNDNINF